MYVAAANADMSSSTMITGWKGYSQAQGGTTGDGQRRLQIGAKFEF